MENGSTVSRRTVLAGMAAVPAVSLLDSPAAAAFTQQAEASEVKLTWLEGKPDHRGRHDVGYALAEGRLPADQTFALTDADGKAVPVQSWPIAYWPDGSLKWTRARGEFGHGQAHPRPLGRPPPPPRR